MARLPRLLALVLVLAVLTGTAAQAAPFSHPARESSRSAGFFGGLLQWVDARLASLPRLLAVWGEAGCEMDPDGRCIDHPASAPVPPDSSSSLGEPSPDAGCDMDPNGSC
jgi:hypothetical protein